MAEKSVRLLGGPPAALSERSIRAGVMQNGVVAGLIGAVVVAVWFLILDVVQGHPFLTPSLLGCAIFKGCAVEAVTSVDVTMVFAYTGLHGVLFLFAGVAIAWMFSQFEQNPQFGMVLLLLFFLFESLIFSFEVTTVPHLVGALETWAVAVGNLLSAAAMFKFLLRRHPKAIAQLRAGWED